MLGSRAMEPREPRQARKGAAVNEPFHVPRGRLGTAARRRKGVKARIDALIKGGSTRNRSCAVSFFSIWERKNSMPKKKVYAVKRGRMTGLFTSWDECKTQVDGFAGAIYKGFTSLQEAQAWLFGSEPIASLFGNAPPKKTPLHKNAVPDELPSPELSSADYVVYTDGSCLRNPNGPGGYAAVIVEMKSGTARELSGGEPSTTNNRMELRAGIEALRTLPPDVVVDFYTDSQYLKNAFAKHWLLNWKRRGWVTSTGEPVKNQDLWRALDEEFHLRTVRFHWVKGHAGNRRNERCDALARGEAEKFL